LACFPYFKSFSLCVRTHGSLKDTYGILTIFAIMLQSVTYMEYRLLRGYLPF